MNIHPFTIGTEFTAMSDADLETDGGIAPVVVWGAVCATVAAIGVFSDAVNGVYDFAAGWNNYEPTPHVTSTISY